MVTFVQDLGAWLRGVRRSSFVVRIDVGELEMWCNPMGGETYVVTMRRVPSIENVARIERIERATRLSELSGVRWARCYADLLEADLA